MLNNRQGNNNRRRGRNNNQRPQNNGQGRNGDNGNRIDNRARGNAPQLLEKYRGLARDAQMAGDRVLTEYYHQFADHYFRVVQESRARFEDNRRPRDDWDAADGDEHAQDARSGFDEGDDEDFVEEQRRDRPAVTADRQSANGERAPRPSRFAENDEAEDGEMNAETGGERSRWEQRMNANQRQDRRPREERGPREDRNARDDRGPRRPRFQPEEAAPARADAGEAQDGPLTLDLTVLPPAIAPSVTDADAPDDAAPAPKRRGRPRKVVAETAAD